MMVPSAFRTIPVKDDRFIRSPEAVDGVGEERKAYAWQPAGVNAAICTIKRCEVRTPAAADYRYA